MTFGKGLAATVALALAGGLTGCGESCPSETVAKIQDVGACTARPGTSVTVPVQLCPTCNQSGSSCDVEIQGSFVQLDIRAEACDSVASCGSTAPSCQPPSGCTFTAPAEGTYTVLVYDPSTDRTIERPLVVSTTQNLGCSINAAAIN